MKCFFCDIQSDSGDRKIIETDLFFSRFDNFPITPGHSEIIPKKHIDSIFSLSNEELLEMHDLILKTKLIIDEKFHPDGYNIGINEGEASGQTIKHLHVHLIPRYIGDVENPRGGVRNIIPDKGDYSEEVKRIGREKYL